VRGFSALPASGPIPRPDLVIVARGGGSIEDLWSFNEEIVVRAIAGSTIPVISAVGHETDTTLADFAADLRAPTPTAAAEIAVPVREDLAAQLAEFAFRQRRCALRPVQLGRERLEARAQRLPRPEALVEARAQKLDDLAERLRRGLADRIVIAREGLHRSAGRLSAPLLSAQVRHARQHLLAVRLRPEDLVRRIDHARQRLDSLERVRLQLDPRAPLKRGYALVTGPDGHVVSGKAAAQKLAAMTLEFHDGALQVAPSAAPRPPRPAPKAPPPGQGDLF
jgi:exodeoxyribonuclease VII large subunit